MVRIDKWQYRVDEEDACDLLQSAIENAEATGELFLLWRLQASLSRLYHNIGQQEAAEEQFATARSLVGELVTTIPDKTLKEGFRQGAYNILKTPP